ncbi:MAG: gamma-glutamyltransferase [Alphaproteobacteria bacterium]|nr:gamma-glutamyltransferase [Alphaproteobacteria bacterium]
MFKNGTLFKAILASAIICLPNWQESIAQDVETTGGNAYSYRSQTRFHPEVAEHGMVTAIETLAAEAGRDILKAGGNAVDAAVATGFALAVTHPVAGNIGGGGFMLISLPNLDHVVALDYREMAPAAATRDMMLDSNGDYDPNLSLYTYLGTGVPGSVMGMTQALEKYGTMSLEQVMAPAIKLAEEGHILNYAKQREYQGGLEILKKDPSSIRYFLKKDGSPYKMGERLIQKDLANTLKLIAKEGAKGFYEGKVADLIVKEMKTNRGLITLEDLKNYKAVERQVLKGTFRGYDIYSMPPASSGGVHLIELLNILEGYDLKSMGPNSADYIHVLVEAMRRVYADRSEYLGDSDFYPVPIDKLTDKNYAAKLRESIDLTHASRSEDIKPGLDMPYESPQTTHYSVMDKDGGAVSVTTTINVAFGGGGSVDGAGFLLNNEMDDFSAKPGAPNAFGLIGGVANQIEPGKRPLSAMSPTIIFKNGKPYMVTGSPGGSTIITVVLQMVLNVLEFDMNIAEASAAPRIHHQWWPDKVVLEQGISQDTFAILKSRGFKLSGDRINSPGENKTVMGRTNSIIFDNGVFTGYSDLRGIEHGVAGY